MGTEERNYCSSKGLASSAVAALEGATAAARARRC